MALSHLPARTDYVDSVYQALLDAISDGTLAPGERLTQEDLAERFKVSRIPVLQALRLLKKDGLLEDAPGRGVWVTRLDATDIGHLYQVRGALDALAARLAAERHARLAPNLIREGRRAAAGSDVAAMIAADTAFHRAIYEASGNPFILGSAQLHWVHLRRAMGAVLQHDSGRTHLWDEHAALAQAIAKGDVEAAAALSLHHTQSASAVLVQRLARRAPLDAAARAG